MKSENNKVAFSSKFFNPLLDSNDYISINFEIYLSYLDYIINFFV